MSLAFVFQCVGNVSLGRGIVRVRVTDRQLHRLSARKYTSLEKPLHTTLVSAVVEMLQPFANATTSFRSLR